MLKTIIIITIVTLLVSSVGWKKFIYFFSLGYGYGIASIAITLAVLYWKDLSWYSAAMLVLLCMYGVRLGTFLLQREMKSAAYVKTVELDEITNDMRPTGVLFSIWISCAILYICQTFPVTVLLQTTSEGIISNPIWTYIGLGVAIVGFLMETIADHQKSAAKRINAKRFVLFFSCFNKYII